MKLPYTMGIELTGVPKVPFDTENKKVIDQYTSENGRYYMTRDWPGQQRFVNRIYRDLNKGNFGFMGRAHIDGHCFELSSPIFDDLETMKKWFIKTRKVMKEYKLNPHHPDVVCGGGHIHVGIPMKLKSFRKKIMNSVRHHYFLPWVFAQPDEEDSCDVNQRGKCGAICDAWTTLEFRFFESALNWSEQWDHVEFVIKYIRWVSKQKTVKFKFYTNEELNQIDQKEAIRDFKKLLGKMGLSYDRYAKYVNRNLKPRWELDRVRK